MKTFTFAISLLMGVISALSAMQHPPKSEPGEPKKLESLLDRCQKLADMQLVLYNGTKELDKIIKSNTDKKPRSKDKYAALKLADKAKEISVELTKIYDTLKKEDASVAFLEVFEEVRKDVKLVQRRLEDGDAGEKTQALQQDILETLKEMVAALKK